MAAAVVPPRRCLAVLHRSAAVGLASRRCMATRVILRRGRIEAQRSAAIVTSANDALAGNDQPTYWRFEARQNVDGAVRCAGGSELAAACAALDPVSDASAVRRDVARWPGGCKRGPSKVVRCPTGTAVATKAFGRLEADVVVHAVAPDVELTFGRYRGRPYGDTGDDRDRLPEELLRDAYSAALGAAASAGAASVACPALGAGVKGWNAAVSASFGLEAAARAAGGALDEVAFVAGTDAAAWAAWTRVARALLGPPPGLEDDDAFADAAGRSDELTWTLDEASAVDGDLLPIATVDEFALPRARWATEAAGTATGGHSWRWSPSDVRAV